MSDRESHILTTPLDPVGREGKRMYLAFCSCGWETEGDTREAQIASMQYHQLHTLWTEAGHGWRTP